MNGCAKHSVEFEVFVNNFIETTFELEPTFGVYMGRHEFDGQLPNWSKAGIMKHIEFLKDSRFKAVGFEDGNLGKAQQFDKKYLLAVIDEQLFSLDEAKLPFTNPVFYGAIGPDVYLSREYAPLEKRMKAYTVYANNVPVAVGQIIENMETPLPKTFAELGKRISHGLATHMLPDHGKFVYLTRQKS